MSSPLGDWVARGAKWYELYVRWSFYLLVIFLHLAAILFLLGGHGGFQAGLSLPPLLLLMLLLIAGHTVCVIIASGHAFDRLRGRPRPMRIAFRLIWGGLFLASLGLSLVMWITQDIFLGAGVFAAIVVAAVVPVTPLLRMRRMLLLCIALTVLLSPMGLSPGVLPLIIGWVWFGLWSAWSTAWMLRVLHELQRAGETRRELALAEERLRISRDLHDVFGRTLAAIAVKSTLAAELVRRGNQEQAAAEMAAVRTLADEAGTEVRRVVRGQLHSSWHDELAGARTLLASAGIGCAEEGPAPPEEHAGDCARILREAVTNVLRHSEASQVTVTTRTGKEGTLLVIGNDGAHGPGGAEGTGLASMRERLSASGGSLQVLRDAGRFRLEAFFPGEPTPAGSLSSPGTKPSGTKPSPGAERET